jgi:integrase
MTERVRLLKPHKRPKRAKKETRKFTDMGIFKLKPPEKGHQKLYWDTVQRGLCLLVSPGGAKTFRSTFNLDGVWIARTLGRFGEVVQEREGEEDANITWARAQVRNDRFLAKQGIDPRAPHGDEPQRKLTYRTVVDPFIEHYAKPRQRTWDQTERTLKNTCKAWLDRPFDSIKKKDAYALLEGFKAAGHPYKAAITLRWLKTLWKWAWQRDLVPSPIMEAVTIDYEKRERDRVYSDDEIKATWDAKQNLDPIEAGYVKLLILLAPRKTALACLQWSHLDDPDNPTLWTTPFELTKSRKNTTKKRVYLTPLPPLAQRIIKGLPKRDGEDLLFPDLPVHRTRGGQSTFEGIKLVRKMIEHGAPEDFDYHAWRHTIATWLQVAGYSEWERGLALNHSSSGSVTAGYSHGYPLELKRKLLEKWADHIERLVQPEGAVLLR